MFRRRFVIELTEHFLIYPVKSVSYYRIISICRPIQIYDTSKDKNQSIKPIKMTSNFNTI